VYARPQTLREAVAALTGHDALVLGGGTDIYPAYVGRPLLRDVVDISRVSELRGVGEEAGYYRIGAATRWSDIIRAPLPPAFDALKQAAREVGSVQIQNRATIGGNICNASPAADGVPPFLVLDAEVELASASGPRRMPLSAFITGYRQTALATGEILSAILVPKSVATAGSAFVKLGARRYMVISIVMAAALLQRGSDGRLAKARAAVGAASAVAQRLRDLERDLEGLAAHVRPSTAVKPHHLAALTPIDDVRATAGYRRDAALHLIGEALDLAAGAGSGG
jgi:CO/xanthine dehydrogenase FAD-binding subunit